MVTTRTIRGVGRRVLLAFLATAGVAGPAAAQTGAFMPSTRGPASSFGLNDVPLAPGEVIVNSSAAGTGAIHHNGGSYQIVDSSAVPMASGAMMDPTMMPAASDIYGGYPSQHAGGCATGHCGGGYAGGYAGMGGAPCGTPCNPYLYASLEGLYIKQTNVDNFTASPDFGLNDFDYEFGVRGTVGLVPDCRSGMEVSFTGPIEWNTEESIPSAGSIDTFLFPRSPFALNALDTFSNAIFQAQRYEAEYFSVEGNRTLIGWEICKFLYGVRYVDYTEDYFYRSVIASGDQGLLRSSTENKMIGAQIGLDMTYPITCKMWSDVRARAGAYGNFAENEFEVSNGSNPLVRNFDDDIELAGLFEIGSGVRYYVTDDFHVRAGTELWYLTGVATSIDQFNAGIGRNSGRQVNIDDDVLMVGLSAGAELKF